MDENVIRVLLAKLNAAIRKGFSNISDLTIETNDGNALMTFVIDGTSNVIWELASERDFVRMRCETKMEGVSYEENCEIAEAMLEKISRDAAATADEGLITIQYLYQFKDSQNAPRNIFYETIAFIQPICANIHLLKVSDAEPEQVELFEAGDEYSLFNYDSIDVDPVVDAVVDPVIDPDDSLSEIVPIFTETTFDVDDKFDATMQEFMGLLAQDKDISISPDDIDIMFEGDEADEEFSSSMDLLKDAEGMVDEAYDSLRSALSAVSDLNGSLFVREKEISSREKTYSDKKKELDEDRIRFEDEYEKFIKERDELNEIKVSAEELRKKESEIADLKAALDAEKSGEAKQTYIKELRRKNSLQEDQITQLNAKVSQCNVFVNSLQAIHQETKEKASAMVEEANARANEAILKLSEERKARIKDREETHPSENVEKLKNELLSATKMVDDTTAAAEREKQAREELQERFDMLQERNSKIEQELENAKNILENAKNQENARNETARNDVDISSLRDDMRTAGIPLDIMPGEGTMMLGGSYQECEISVDVDSHVIFIQKEIKKTKPAINDLDHLNNTDINTSFFVTHNKMLQCKAFCYDLNNCVQVTINAVNEVAAYE